MRKPMHRRYLSVADYRDYQMALAAVNAAAVGPTSADLNTAPVLNEWCPASWNSTTPVLIGRVQNHPNLGDTLVRTSRLIGLDVQVRWARTFNRWYRLGSRATNHSKCAEIPLGTSLLNSRLDLEAMMDEYIKLVRKLESTYRRYQ